MGHFTAKDRVRAAFKRGFADMVPSYPMLGAFNAKLIGCSIKQFLTVAAKFADAQLKGYEVFQPDIIIMMADLLKESEALGTKLRFPEDGPCVPLKYALEEKSALAKLASPDPGKDGRMPYYFEACEGVVSAVKDAPVSSVLTGPWSTALNLRGAERLIFDTVDDPQFVHDLLDVTTRAAISFGEAAVQAGVGLSYSEPGASCSLISPKIFRDFVRPRLEEIVNHFKERKIAVSFHICGFVDPVMEDLLSTGASALSIDSKSSLERMVQLNNKRAVIIGNVDTELFRSATRDAMGKAVKKCLDIAAKESAFILSSACEIPIDSPIENIHFFMEAARGYGRYPL